VDTGAQRQARIEAYRQRLAAAPESGVFVPLAELLAADGDLDGAVTVLEAGLARLPRSVAARVVLGRILLAAGRGERAREVLAEVLDADADNLVARQLLADDARRRGDWEASVGHLDHLARLEPEEERWTAALAEAHARAEGSGAAGQAGFATMTMVDIYVAQGYLDRAAEALRRILAAQPDRADARRRLAEVEAALAEAGEAAPPDGEDAPAAGGEARRRQRSVHKEQFARWIERIRHDEEASP